MSKGLQRTFLFHAFLCAVVGIVMYLGPMTFLALVQWTPIDPVLTRLYGAALLTLAVSSWLGARATVLAEVHILIIMEIVFTLIGSIALIYDAFFSGAPAFAWVILAIWVPFLLAWVTFYYRTIERPKPQIRGSMPV